MKSKCNVKNVLLRLLAAALSLLMLLSFVACGKDENPDDSSASAQQSSGADDSSNADIGSGFTLVISEAEGKPGDTVTLKVSLVNNPGVHGYSFCLDYSDKVFSAAEGKITMENSEYSVVSDKNNDIGMNYQWTNLTAFEKDGEICELTLTIAEDAAPGSYSVKAKFREVYDSFYQILQEQGSDGININEKDIPVTVVNGKVTVVG